MRSADIALETALSLSPLFSLSLSLSLSSSSETKRDYVDKFEREGETNEERTLLSLSRVSQPLAFPPETIVAVVVVAVVVVSLFSLSLSLFLPGSPKISRPHTRQIFRWCPCARTTLEIYCHLSVTFVQNETFTIVYLIYLKGSVFK